MFKSSLSITIKYKGNMQKAKLSYQTMRYSLHQFWSWKRRRSNVCYRRVCLQQLISTSSMRRRYLCRMILFSLRVNKRFALILMFDLCICISVHRLECVNNYGRPSRYEYLCMHRRLFWPLIHWRTTMWRKLHF